MDDIAERLTLRQGQTGLESAAPSQRQIDLEVELLERKVRLFVGRAELIEKKDRPAPPEVQDDVVAVQEKWNMLLKMVDEARRDDDENERLRRHAAEVDCSHITLFTMK